MSKKIPVNRPQPGLNSAFEGLEVGGLPAGGSAVSEGAPESAPPPPDAPRRGRVVLRREKAHRGGKTVIVVHDFAPSISNQMIEGLSGRLKAACACGGTVRGREIEIQGDQPGRIRELLEKEGFRVAGIR